MHLTPDASGTFAIAPTPFFDDGRIDYESIDRLTDFYAKVGCNGVTVLGILGEAPKLEGTESLEVATRFIRRNPKLQIIVGVSAPGFASMRTLARASMDAGAAAVMIAPPPHLRTDDQITGYFRQAAEAIGDDIPWVLQDYPLTLTVVMTPAVIRKIVMDSKSCVMLKHEDWPGLEKISTLRGYQKDGSLRPMSILTGNGALFLDFEMERGADGAMTGYAFPELLIDVVNKSKAGDRDGAHDIFDAHLPLIRYEQQPGVGLSVRKYVLKKRGFLTSDAQRKPGAAMTAASRAEVDYLLSRVARTDKRAAHMSEPDKKALRIASTVLLLRDGADGMEIFMVQRNRAIEFASGALVFPGGSIDPGDYEIAETLATDLPNELAAIRVAGVRETFEESGILLARPKGSDALVAAEIATKVGPLRAAVDKGEIKFAAILNDNDLVPAIDLLVPFAHWITPVNMPKRFDTHFLLAHTPKDHVGRHDGHESVDSIWLTPRAALDGADSGRFTLPFPTIRNLIKLDKLKTAQAAMDFARKTPVVTVIPELTKNESGGNRLKIPKEAGYDGEVFDFQV